MVSLVPSATESLIALGVTPVGCTRFCEQPGMPTVGGTKDPDIGAVLALAPDLVVVNDEENRREDAGAITAAGVTVHSISPRAVDEVSPALAALARAVGVPQVACADARGEPMPIPPAQPITGAAVTLIWRRPWMTQRSDTYGSSVLEHLGWSNPFADAADRYSEVQLSELAAAAPGLVVLPNEPYPFAARHVPAVAAAVPSARIALVDGRDLFWWGTRTASALARLGAALG